MAEIALSTLFEANVVECFMKDWLICGPSSVFNLGVTISQDPGTFTARWNGKSNSTSLDTSTAHEQNEIAQNTHTLYTRNHMIIQVHRMTTCTRDYDDTRIYTYTCRI